MTWIVKGRKIWSYAVTLKYWQGSGWASAQSLACRYSTRDAARDVARSLASARVVRLVPGPRMRELLAERDAAVAVADRQRERAKAAERERDMLRSAAPAWVDTLAAAIARAERIHPDGPDGMRALSEEVGEVASALRRETPERVCEELLDVAVVAIRWREMMRKSAAKTGT